MTRRTRSSYRQRPNEDPRYYGTYKNSPNRGYYKVKPNKKKKENNSFLNIILNVLWGFVSSLIETILSIGLSG